MTATWDEVKKLAADFQRTQLAEATQRLNDRNCVEIVRKIIQLQLLDVVFTTDGKEYVTPDYLLTEIENELYANNGQVYLTDLAKTLQIDLSLIEAKAQEVAKQSNGRFSLILGQLISNEFKDQTATELNERLQSKGMMTLSEMVKMFDFPPDFLAGLLNSRLGSIVQGIQDPNDPQTYFTKSFLNQHRSKIVGVLNAITRPTPLSQLISSHKFPPKIFHTVIAELVGESLVRGTVTPGHNGSFVPEIYSRIQQKWVDEFLSQNSYVEYDALQRIGFSDPKSFCKKFNNPPLLLLNTCAITQIIYDQIEAEIEEVLKEQTWTDLITLTPTVLDLQDLKCLFKLYCDRHRSNGDHLLMVDSVVVCKRYIESLLPLFEPDLNQKVTEDIQSSRYATYVMEKSGAFKSNKFKAMDKEQPLSRKEERKRQSTGKAKSSGGGQNREVKVKSVKKKYNKKDEWHGSDDEANQTFATNTSSHDSAVELSFLTRKEIESLLPKKQPNLENASEQLKHRIAEYLYEPLKNRFLESAQRALEESQNACSSGAKKSHADLKQSATNLFGNFLLFDKGIKCCQFSAELQLQLEKHLLRTTGVEYTNALLSWASPDDSVSLATFEARSKCIKKLPSEFIESFNRLNTATNASSIEEFQFAAEEAAEKVDIMLQRPDKRKEKQMLLDIRSSLLEQVDQTSHAELALLLHLAVLIAFSYVYQYPLNASGKFVPQLLVELRPKLLDSAFDLLSRCEQLVVRKFKKDLPQEEQEVLQSELLEVLPLVKHFIKNAENLIRY